MGGLSVFTLQQAALQPQELAGGFVQQGALQESVATACFLQQSAPQQDFAWPELQQHAAPLLQQADDVVFWQQAQSQQDFSKKNK